MLFIDGGLKTSKMSPKKVNNTPVEAKKYILRALANIGTADAIPALAKMLTGSDALLR